MCYLGMHVHVYICVFTQVYYMDHLNKQKNNKDKIQINVYLRRKVGDKGGERTLINTNYCQCSNSLAVYGIMDVHYIIYKWINNMIIIRVRYGPMMTTMTSTTDFD